MWLLLSTALALTPAEVPNPRASGAWVADMADVIPAEAEARMNASLAAVHADTDAEIAVVTVPDVPGEARAFATQLFEGWGVGDQSADNGLVVLLVVDQRRLSMVTGYGIEPVLPDGWLGGMQARAMVPRFKTGDFAGGLQAGLSEVEARLRANAAEVREGSRRAESSRDVSGPEARAEPTSSGLSGLALLVGLPLAGLTALIAALARRPRKCQDCAVPMVKLRESEEDAHLNAGQQREEEIGSVQWDVWLCPKCRQVELASRSRWSSGYDRCPQCNFRTLSQTTVELEEATVQQEGVVEVRTRCEHCHHRSTHTRKTPRLPEPVVYAAATTTTMDTNWSSTDTWSGGSGGDSGGSFGGGHTGGGGADSSW